MPTATKTLAMYLHLARASHARRQATVRDKLLVLAGVAAEEMGLESVSADCRGKILSHNARHLIRQWPTMEAAVADDDFQSYLKQLRRQYSSEKIEHMLSSLGIEMGREREAYFTDLEYATALVDSIPKDFPSVLSAARGELSKGGTDDRQDVRPLRDALIVWAPFVVGLALLGVLAAIASVKTG